MASIAAAFDKLPALTGNASKFIRVNSSATAQEAVAATGSGDVALSAGPVTWSPTITAATPGTMSATYGGTNTATYIKVGNMVTIGMLLNFTLTKGTATGAFRINLPAAIQTLTSAGTACGVVTGHDFNLATIGGIATTGFTQFGTYISSFQYLVLYVSGVGKTAEVLQITDFNNGNQQVLLGISYAIA